MAVSIQRLMIKIFKRHTLLRHQTTALSNRLFCTKSSNGSGHVDLHEQTCMRANLQAGPPLEHFIANSSISSKPAQIEEDPVPYLSKDVLNAKGRKVFFDVYGCQMNTNDTEVVLAVLQKYGYVRTRDIQDANIVLVMTCAIRDSAEQKIWNKIQYLTILKKKKGYKKFKIGILGMAAANFLSYICLSPMVDNHKPKWDSWWRLGKIVVVVLVSIMRGCDNMCSYCIVPFTRGRERSRPIDSILEEVKQLSDKGMARKIVLEWVQQINKHSESAVYDVLQSQVQGVKEVVLLGQNVNSYRDTTESKFYGLPNLENPSQLRHGFKTVYKAKCGGRRFSDLLDKVSQVNPEMRVRFTAAHPKDFPDEVLYLIRDRANICNQLHLPCQSGSTSVLQAMRRGYTRESYLELVDHVKSIIPDVALTSDVISGFCGETEKDHRETLDLLKIVKYSMVYSFPYSMRQKTHAYHRLEDNVQKDVKARRSQEVKEMYLKVAESLHKSKIGQYQLVLVEKENNKSQILGKNDEGVVVAMPNSELTCRASLKKLETGDYVIAKVYGASAKAFLGQPIQFSSIEDFTRNFS